MKRIRIGKTALAVSASATIAFLAMNIGPTKAHAQQQDSDQYLASIGLQIAPSFINAAGKDMTLVGLGSFIVNAEADCNGCHNSNPANELLATNNPYLLGQSKNPLILTANMLPLKFDPATYLAGGNNFGPAGPGTVSDPTSPVFTGPGTGPAIITRNLTPDYTGNPAGGMDLATFLSVMRGGHDGDALHPNCGTFETDLGTYVTVSDNCYGAPVDGDLLQVMPWPKFKNMSDYQLTAIWTYLSTVPCNPHDDDLGKAMPWLQNSCIAPGQKSLRVATGVPVHMKLRRLITH